MSEWEKFDPTNPPYHGRYAVIIFNHHFPENGAWTDCGNFAHGKWNVGHATVTHFMELPDIPAGTVNV